MALSKTTLRRATTKGVALGAGGKASNKPQGTKIVATPKKPNTLFNNPGRPNVNMVKPKAPVAKKPPTAAEYAAQDPDYRRAQAGYQQNLASFTARNQANQNDVNQDYATTRARLLRQFSEDNSTQDSDFGSRGMFGSGVYAKSHADQVRKQDEQSNGSNGDLEVSRDRNLRNLKMDEADAQTLEKQQEQTALQGSIQRATAKLGLTGSSAPAKSSSKPDTKKPVNKKTLQKAANNNKKADNKKAPAKKGKK